VAGVTVPLTAGGRFSAKVPRPESGVLAIWVDHPLVGRHVFVRRTVQCDPFACQSGALHGACCAQLDVDRRRSVSGPDRRRSVSGPSRCDPFREIHGCAKVDAGNTAGSASCDLDDLVTQGEEDEGYGQHAAALAKFEQALACKPNDVDATKHAFVAACNAVNVAKAKLYYAKLSRRDQAVLAQICIRFGITKADLEGTAAQSAHSQIVVRSKPQAHIFVDGEDRKLYTPAVLEVEPGRHKVTLVIGQDSYTYGVTAPRGDRIVLDKDFQ
jgi:hypothetical protein